MLTHDTGVLSATTAFGKTVVAAWLIAERADNTLVLVHRRQLVDQWLERLSAFLRMRKEDRGQIGGGKKRTTGKLDVVVIQSLVRKGVVKDLVADYGHIIVDECHHLSARSAVGYTVLIPGSAVPGWPVEVALPVDPLWKSEYAASVRRLVHDGVDAPLTQLFVHVARKPEPGAKGADRARSATEKFFYRRLESLPETTGRYRKQRNAIFK